ncbi:MAG TPA: AI-2E family transporter [Methylophilaceae bacterium]|nr:AI-2E family transporter [Methylophilaceae bacterium]
MSLVDPHSPMDDKPVPAAEPDVTALPPALPIIHVRGATLIILSTLAVIAVLEWAQSFVISVLLGILFAYTLNPLVDAQEKLRIPRFVGATVVIVLVIWAVCQSVYSLRFQAESIIEMLPVAANRLSVQLTRDPQGAWSNLQRMRTAANKVEEAANSMTGNDVRIQHVPRISIEDPIFKFENFIWSGSLELVAFAGQTIMVVFLTYFLLLSGDTFKRKLVKLTGPSLSRKRITVHIIDDINISIQKYLFMLLVTNLLVILLSWLAFMAIGLENAGIWAIVAGLLHLVPYFGPLITSSVTGVAAFMQFNSLIMAISVAAINIVIATFVGIFVTTWMTGRIARMNATAVFISLLFWGWLWGIWGMLLSIPIIVIVKVVSQHVEQLHPVAELLGE